MIATPTAMRSFGGALAELLRAGDLVLLIGDVGAGKTTLAQGIGAGLGVPDAVRSPTFILARVHHGGRLPLVHVDAYRLGSVAELDDLDLDSELPVAVTLVEWGRGLAEVLAADRLEVVIARPADPSSEIREVDVVAHGDRWHGVALPG